MDINNYPALANATNLPDSQQFKFCTDPVAYETARPVMSFLRRTLAKVAFNASLVDQVKRHLFYQEKFRLALTPEDFRTPSILPAVAMRRDRTDFLHGVIGAITEAGELAEILDSFLVGTHADDKPMSELVNKTHVMEEVGDVMWYLPLIAKSCGFSLNEAAAANIRKLRARYPDGFNELAAQFRDLAVELEKLDEQPKG